MSELAEPAIDSADTLAARMLADPIGFKDSMASMPFLNALLANISE